MRYLGLILLMAVLSLASAVGQTLKWNKNGSSFEVTAITPSVFRVVYSDRDVAVPDSTHSAVIQPEEIVFCETENLKGRQLLRCDNVSVELTQKPFSITFKQDGATILTQNLLPTISPDERKITLSVDSAAPIFGAGMQATALDRRGEVFEMYNRPGYGYGYGRKDMNYNLPMIYSADNYILYFDNPQKGKLDVCANSASEITFSAIGGPMVYYVIIDSSYEQLMKNYAQLVGLQEIPPLWSLGTLVSRMGYRSEAEARSIVDKMQESRFPMDGLILDLYWFGDTLQTTMGNLEWYTPNWPTPEKMISDFDDKGVKTIIITEPYIVKTALKWDEADSLGILAKNSIGESYVIPDFYFGEGSLLDVFASEPKMWMTAVYDRLKAQGVAGWWVDLAEPEYHPADMLHVVGSGDQIHNIYGHYWDKMMFDHWSENYPNERLFNLNRSGWIGSQRYSVFPWSGDVGRSWDGLKGQLPVMLGMSVGGVPYNHSDLGGFAMGEWDDELYTRWLQMGTFTPIYRLHASGDVPSEPIFFADSTQVRARKSMETRYQLMPYIYTMAFENSISGEPLIRPLFFQETDTSATILAVDDQYFFGPSLMIAPVYTQGQKQREVYLPAGNSWYDFYTNVRYDGGQTITVDLTLDHIPVFVKSGSILPQVPLFYSTKDYNTDTLRLNIYPGQNNTETQNVIYVDDGKTRHAYQKSEYELIDMVGQYRNGVVNVALSRNNFGFAESPVLRQVEVEVFNVPVNPQVVYVQGETGRIAAEVVYHPETKSFTFWFQWDGDPVKLIVNTHEE